MKALVPLLAAAALLGGCMATSSGGGNVANADRGQYPRGPMAEAEAEQTTAQLLEARAQRDAAVAALSAPQTPEARRRLQQTAHDHNQMVLLMESRLRAAGRPIPR